MCVEQGYAERVNHWDVLHAADLLRNDDGGLLETLPLDVCQTRLHQHCPTGLRLTHHLLKARHIRCLSKDKSKAGA